MSRNIKSAKVSIACKSFHFRLQNFKDLSTTRNHYVKTPEFTCSGHEWRLLIYPGGNSEANEGHVSIFLHHQSEGSITVGYELQIIDKFGKKRKAFKKDTDDFKGMAGRGWRDFTTRHYILNESQNILDSNGALTVGVSIKEEESSDVFVPKNPFQKMVLKDMFLDEDTADVCFEVISSAEAKQGTKKKAKASDLFHAHHCILKTCAPMLADLFDLEDKDGKLATVTIAGIKLDIFRHLLYYVYGGSVPDKELKANAKAIIDAADKYSIINLKLEAEAVYVKSTDITMDNAMDNLLYADAKNCPLLKEAVMNFLAENHYEAAEKISFTDFPPHVVKDLLIAVGRNSNSKKDKNGTADELTTLSVSDLRRKLAEKGLDVDGSREAMIESIKDNATNSDDDNNNDDDDNDGGNDNEGGDNEDD